MNKFLVSLFVVAVFLFSPIFVLAQASTQNNTQTQTSAIPSLSNPLKANTPQQLIGQIINAVLGLVGSLALLMFVFGGLTWMTSGGNAEKIKKGRDILVWAAIGLVVVFSAYGLVRVLILGVGAN